MPISQDNRGTREGKRLAQDQAEASCPGSQLRALPIWPSKQREGTIYPSLMKSWWGLSFPCNLSMAGSRCQAGPGKPSLPEETGRPEAEL